MENTVTTLVNS